MTFCFKDESQYLFPGYFVFLLKTRERVVPKIIEQLCKKLLGLRILYKEMGKNGCNLLVHFNNLPVDQTQSDDYKCNRCCKVPPQIVKGDVFCKGYTNQFRHSKRWYNLD